MNIRYKWKYQTTLDLRLPKTIQELNAHLQPRTETHLPLGYRGQRLIIPHSQSPPTADHLESHGRLPCLDPRLSSAHSGCPAPTAHGILLRWAGHLLWGLSIAGRPAGCPRRKAGINFFTYSLARSLAQSQLTRYIIICNLCLTLCLLCHESSTILLGGYNWL